MEDEYFWAKHNRPCPEKDVDRNTATNYIMRHLKTEGAILKTCDPNGQNYSKNSKDLVPFVMYSANKQKRWETVRNFNLMEEIQKIHSSDADVVVLECVNLNSAFMSYLNYYQFPIRQFHKLLTDNTYEHIATNSVWGQSYKNFFQVNALEAPKKNVIAYHFITPPKNYENLMKNDFCPGSSADRYWGSRTIAHERRHQNKHLTQLELRYRQFEECDDIVDMTDDYEIYDKNEPPRQFYNLEDHIVDKFVIVKKKKKDTGSSECSDTWSLISDL